MPLQAVWPGEALPTVSAQVRPRPGVCGAVPLELAELREPPGAERAPVGLLSSVCPPVFEKVLRRREPLPTQVAPVGLLSGVDSPVHGQVRGCGEGLSTQSAGMRTLAVVRGQLVMLGLSPISTRVEPDPVSCAMNERGQTQVRVTRN